LANIARINRVQLKQLFKVITEQETVQPVLSLRIGMHHCSVSITDFATGNVKMLGYYASEEVTQEFLDELLLILPELSSGYYRVMVAYDYPQSLLVPVSAYSQDENNTTMQALFGVNGTAVVVAEKLTDWQLYNVFAVPKEIHTWVAAKFPAAKYWQETSVILKNYTAKENETVLLADFREKEFTVVLLQNNNLLLAQTYDYTAPADVIYYLLKVCQQFSISQEVVRLHLSGLIDRESSLYKELYNYFLFTEFRQARWTIADSQYPEHYFTALNDLAACAS